MLVEKNKDIY